MAKRFTLAQAQSLIPHVDRLLREAVSLKSEYQDADQIIQRMAHRVSMMGGMVMDREKAIDSKNHRDAAASKLRAAVEEVQQMGCVVKDLDTGLVDFPTLFRDVEVYLCWRLGETAIEFWHSTDEGFRGRKPIDQDFLDHHRGDRAQ